MDGAGLACSWPDPERPGKAVVGIVRHWPAPHVPEDVVDEATVLLKRLGIRSVIADRYGAALQETLWVKRGIQYIPSHLSASQLHMGMVSVFAGRLVSLPNHPVLL